MEAQRRAEAARPQVPPFPADYEAQIRAQLVAPPPPEPLESNEATVSAWRRAMNGLQLDEWIARRVKDAQVYAAQGLARPGSWVEAAAQGPQVFDAWLRAQQSLGAIADAAALGFRIRDDAVARAVEYRASYAYTKAQPDFRAGYAGVTLAQSNMGRNFEGGGAAAGGFGAIASALGAIVVAAFDMIATYTVKGPRTGGAGDPLTEPTAEAFGLLPVELRLTLLRAAQRLPPWPAEDVILAWDAAGRYTGPKPPLLRLGLEAKRRGLWPADDQLWPLPGTSRDLARQLRAMLQVGLEVDAATAAGLPYVVPEYTAAVVTTSDEYTPQPGSYPAPQSPSREALLDAAYAEGVAWGRTGATPGIVAPYRDDPQRSAAWSRGYGDGLAQRQREQQPAPPIDPSTVPISPTIDPAAVPVPPAASGAGLAVGVGVAVVLGVGVALLLSRRRRKRGTP